MKSQRITRSLFDAVSNWTDRNTLHDVGTDLNQVANAGRKYKHAPDMPAIVTLCGSTQFKAEFEAVQRLETQNGRIVLSVGMFTHADGWDVTKGMKQELDDLHKRKIDLSDEIIVINVGGYVGESTRSEIEYAIANAVMVRWLNVDKVPAPWGEYVCPHRTAYLAKFSKEHPYNNPIQCKGTNCTVMTGSTDPHSPECVAEHQAALRSGTTGQPDLPPIVPEMLASPNAQPEAPEADTESLDALERAGRLALVEETRKAWMGREVQEPTSISTSGYIAVLPDPIADDARQAYDNRYHKVRAAVSFDSWLRAYRHFVGLDVAAVKGSDIEALAMTNEPHWAAGTLPFDQVG